MRSGRSGQVRSVTQSVRSHSLSAVRSVGVVSQSSQVSQSARQEMSVSQSGQSVSQVGRSISQSVRRLGQSVRVQSGGQSVVSQSSHVGQ